MGTGLQLVPPEPMDINPRAPAGPVGKRWCFFPLSCQADRLWTEAVWSSLFGEWLPVNQADPGEPRKSKKPVYNV